MNNKNTILVLEDTEKELMAQLGHLLYNKKKLEADVEKVEKAINELRNSIQYMLKVEELTNEELSNEKPKT